MTTNKIRQLRQSKQPYMSQWALANKVEVSQSLVTIWERGYKEPNDQQKMFLAKALSSTVDDLFPKDEPSF